MRNKRIIKDKEYYSCFSSIQLQEEKESLLFDINMKILPRDMIEKRKIRLYIVNDILSTPVPGAVDSTIFLNKLKKYQNST